MTPEEAPPCTIVVLGHPANGVTARKDSNGVWKYTHWPYDKVPFDDIHKMARLVYSPQE